MDITPIEEVKIMYDDNFYKKRQELSIKSAREIIPYIMDLFNPSSIIDIGCSNGTWLSVFHELGVTDIIGIDGDWIDSNLLLIPSHNFKTHNLENSFEIDKRFDIATSIEVAEHLSPKRAESFVEDLTKLSDIIVFSAAIPQQGGTGHINEQWPEYWANIFRNHDYIAFDYLRHQIWNNENVNYIHAQNILIFVNAEHIDRIAAVKNFEQYMNPSDISRVHPRHYSHALQRAKRNADPLHRVKKYVGEVIRSSKNAK